MPSSSWSGNINPASNNTYRFSVPTSAQFIPISPKPPRGRNLIGASSTSPPVGKSRGVMPSTMLLKPPFAAPGADRSARIGAVAFSTKSGKGFPSVYVNVVPKWDLPSLWGRIFFAPRPPRPPPRPPRRPPPPPDALKGWEGW